MASPAATHGLDDPSMASPAAGGELPQRDSAAAAAKPEKNLNCFVRVAATGELVGNASGALASLWATLVLLGGYRASLKKVDFWIATVVVFIEAFRVFIRNFKFDNQSLFGSTKAFRWISSSLVRMLWRPQEGDAVVLIIGGVVKIFNPLTYLPVAGSITRVAALTLMSRMQFTETLMRQLQQRQPLQLWAVLIIIILLANAAVVLLTAIILASTRGSPFVWHYSRPGIFLRPNGFYNDYIIRWRRAWAYPTPFLVDFIDILTQAVALVLLLYRRPRRIATLTSGPCGRMLLYMSKVIAVLLFASQQVWIVLPGFTAPFTTTVLLFCSLQEPGPPQEQDPAAANNSLFLGRWIGLILRVCYLLDPVWPLPIAFGLLGAAISLIALLAVLLIGNLQIPLAFAQIGLSSWRLHSLQGGNNNPANMVASIKVFYVLVLCQGSLYIVAIILAAISLVPRRSLVSSAKFGSKWGPDAVDLYYERAYATRMEIGVFGEDTISLASFVVDSLNSASSSRELQHAGLRALYSFLQHKDSNEELVSAVTRSEKAVRKLISMLGWTCEQDAEIRLSAAKVAAELSADLRISIAGIPGAIKLVSSLLDPKNNPPASENDEGNGGDGSQGHQSTGDSLPELGMLILCRLARDPDNCAEIMKIPSLTPKIIGFMNYHSSRSRRDNALISSALNLVSRIATTSWKASATLRQELCESPFFASNLACILEDSRSSPEVWQTAVVDIIATLALDEGLRHELGSVQVIIHKLVRIFIIGHTRDESTNYGQSVRVAAGEALANLAMESPENCLAILEELRDLVKDLKDMLGDDQYRCVAASLLQNLYACSRMTDGWSKNDRDRDPKIVDECSRIMDRLSDPGVRNQISFSSTLTVIVDECSRIMDWLSDPGVRNQISFSSTQTVVQQKKIAKKGRELVALIGLASQITCYSLPTESFVQGQEPRITLQAFVRKLVGTLDSNKKPSREYPRMRRAIVEMVISILGCYPSYAFICREEGMVDALSRAERTPSKVENYRVFLGNEGVVLERGLPLRNLLATAKGQINPPQLNS